MFFFRYLNSSEIYRLVPGLQEDRWFHRMRFLAHLLMMILTLLSNRCYSRGKRLTMGLFILKHITAVILGQIRRCVRCLTPIITSTSTFLNHLNQIEIAFGANLPMCALRKVKLASKVWTPILSSQNSVPQLGYTRKSTSASAKTDEKLNCFQIELHIGILVLCAVLCSLWYPGGKH